MSEDLTSIKQDLAEIKQLLASLRAAPAAKPVEAEVVGVAEAMLILGCKTRRSLSNALADLGIKAIRRGKWRRKDINNALARRSLTPAA